MSAAAGEEFVLLAIPDMNGSLRGKALRPDAFESALEHGTVMTDLIIGLDPVDTPISDYERFGILLLDEETEELVLVLVSPTTSGMPLTHRTMSKRDFFTPGP